MNSTAEKRVPVPSGNYTREELLQMADDLFDERVFVRDLKRGDYFRIHENDGDYYGISPIWLRTEAMEGPWLAVAVSPDRFHCPGSHGGFALDNRVYRCDSTGKRIPNDKK